MLRLKYLSNKYQKRTLRVLYSQYSATPHACVLDSTLRNSDGSFRKPLAADATGGGYPLTRSADAYSLKNGLVPGTVMVKSATAESVAVHNGANPSTTDPNWDDQRDLLAFGLLANFVGGDLDELGDENSVGVWYGFNSVVELLAPAFDDTGLASAYTNATAGNPVRLIAGADGRLKYTASPGNRQVIAQLIERPSASRIVIQMKI